jgi:predicted dehydrogenase
MITRRTFSTSLAATAAVAATATPFTAKSYASIVGSNERVNFAICGLNGRGGAHLSALATNKDDAHVTHICDVDSGILAKFAGKAEKELGYAPEQSGDFRKVLESKDVDVLTIATPDHWHAPMAIYALKAGKHAYCEKPSSHNPREGELLIESMKKHGKLVQVGDQQRSSDYTIKMVQKIKDGIIGRAYYAKAWYTNNRKSMGIGKVAPVPSTLNWDLWQGPVPRSEYKDNIHPYNWHWLFRYGTGESLNNGTHEVDVARWLLGLGYPDSVTSTAGRYAFKDDWQYYDTMDTSYKYPDHQITWEGRCCNNMPFYGRERGVTVHGTTGTVLIDRGGYEIYDLNGKMTKEFKVGKSSSSSDTVGRDSMTDAHFANMIAAIRTGEPLHSPIDIANVSVTMVQHSNIAWRVGHELKIDNKTGHILGDPEAMKLWGRDYEKGWEVTA